MEQTIIFNISGGVGKNIAATAVVHSIKVAYPDSKIIITTPWAIAWLHNPEVEKIVDLERTPFFYRDYIKNKNVKIFRLDPYDDGDFLYRRMHLIDVWCKLCGVPSIDKQPRLFFSQAEVADTERKLISSKGAKPLFFIQASGGASNQPYPISWARDLPIQTAQEVVDEMTKRGFRTIQLRRDTQIPLKNADWIPFSQREAMCAIQFSNKRLFVDSFAAHAAAAHKLSSVVVWVTNSPKVFGYELHDNIEVTAPTEFRHDIDSYLERYNIMGLWHEHPYKDDHIFNSKEILKKLE